MEGCKGRALPDLRANVHLSSSTHKFSNERYKNWEGFCMHSCAFVNSGQTQEATYGWQATLKAFDIMTLSIDTYSASDSESLFCGTAHDYQQVITNGARLGHTGCPPPGGCHMAPHGSLPTACA